MKNLLSGCCLVAMSSVAVAQEIKGIAFFHQNWEMYCSNTGTCRAAGYQADAAGDNLASLFLTRQAGAKQAVTAKFALALYDEQSIPANKLKNIRFYLNGKDLGQVTVDGNESPLMGKLSTSQVTALLQQAQQKSEIVFKNAQHKWNLNLKKELTFQVRRFLYLV